MITLTNDSCAYRGQAPNNPLSSILFAKECMLTDFVSWRRDSIYGAAAPASLGSDADAAL
jgi:hypothetical protein